MKKSSKRVPSPKMSPDHASRLSSLTETAGRYFDHPDVERALGYQVATRAAMNLHEIRWYVQDHVIDPDGEGLTAKDRQLIAANLKSAAELLSSPTVAAIPFALAGAIAERLREAASQVVR
jgi:hypothetical protein